MNDDIRELRNDEYLTHARQLLWSHAPTFEEAAVGGPVDQVRKWKCPAKDANDVG